MSQKLNFRLNINGDTESEMVMNISQAYEKIHEAEKAMRKLRPHGRNYQTVDNSGVAFHEDRERFEEVIKKIAETKNFVEDYMETIYE